MHVHGVRGLHVMGLGGHQVRMLLLGVATSHLGRIRQGRGRRLHRPGHALLLLLLLELHASGGHEADVLVGRARARVHAHGALKHSDRVLLLLLQRNEASLLLLLLHGVE